MTKKHYMNNRWKWDFDGCRLPNERSV